MAAKDTSISSGNGVIVTIATSSFKCLGLTTTARIPPARKAEGHNVEKPWLVMRMASGKSPAAWEGIVFVAIARVLFLYISMA